MNNPTIVVIAYNRPASLQRLLKSLAKAAYPTSEVTLHISIDKSEEPQVAKIAEDFEWKFGPKKVELKSENLGLKRHVLACGQLVDAYESIIILEDDLLVSPSFYQFVQKANAYYLPEEKVAGVSLYAYAVEENNFYPFVPYKGDSDVHFIQMASSWGQSWTKSQWSNFKDWLLRFPHGKSEQLPAYALKWSDNSWKKLFINYLIDTDRYFVFPNHSLTTNFEEFGTNVSSQGGFQVELSKDLKEWKFSSFSDSNAVYDVYFELTSDSIKSIQPALVGHDFDVDLYGTKPLDFSDSACVLTIRSGKSPLASFGAQMKPLIQNIEYDIEGLDIKLIRKSDLLFEEEKPFLLFNQNLDQLKLFSQTYQYRTAQVTLVLPLLELGLKNLRITINSLEIERIYNVTLLISCPMEISQEIQLLTQELKCQVEICVSESHDLNVLLREGMERCITDIVGWMQSGMTVKLEMLEQVGEIFRAMKQVNFLRGIDEESTKAGNVLINSAPYRCTPELGIYYPKEMGQISTEFMFWRRETLKGILPAVSMDNNNLFVESIISTPLYVCTRKFGDRNGVEQIHNLNAGQTTSNLKGKKIHARKSVLSIFRPVFRYFFMKNVPIFRLFYKETERLPLVIRYDFKNCSHYLDNY